MPADVIRFVDSIDASPTVRLDLNDESTFWVKKFEAPPPRLRRSVAENAMRDGVNPGSSTYGGRTLTIEIECRKPTQDAAATEIQKLWRELDRTNNWIQYQPNGLTKPVFFRTYRSDASQLADVMAQAAMRTFTIEVLAEPFALGLKETLGPYTVSNDPAAASNGCYFDVTGVLGDVDAPVVMWDSQASGTLGVRSITVTHTAAAPTMYYTQAESLSLGTDTTNPGGGPDAAMSGTGTNNYVRTSFATNAASVVRVSMSSITAQGQWRVLAFYRRNGTSSRLFVKAEQTDRADRNFVVELPTAGAGGRQVADLGIVTLGSSLRTPGYASSVNSVSTESMGFFASRSGGTDTLDWDGFLLLPVGDQPGELAQPSTLIADFVGNAGTAARALVDGITESAARLTVAGDPTAGAATVSPVIYTTAALPLLTGGFPLLVPGATNRVHYLASGSRNNGFSLEANATKAVTTTVSLAYWPRYLFIRPAAS